MQRQLYVLTVHRMMWRYITENQLKWSLKKNIQNVINILINDIKNKILEINSQKSFNNKHVYVTAIQVRGEDGTCIHRRKKGACTDYDKNIGKQGVCTGNKRAPIR